MLGCERFAETRLADREGLNVAGVVFEREPAVSFAEDVIVFTIGGKKDESSVCERMLKSVLE